MPGLTINRSEVFKAAWAEVNRFRALGLVNTLDELRRRLSYELRLAWSNAKMRIHRAVQAAAPKADNIRAAMSDLENKDRWSDADRSCYDQLATELRADETDADVLDQEEKRDLIKSAAGRFASVTFIKKDGSERTMRVQPAALKYHVKGDAAHPSTRQAAATRKMRHPHLMAVWDVEAKAPRSVNLATIKAITLDGMTYAYP